LIRHVTIGDGDDPLAAHGQEACEESAECRMPSAHIEVNRKEVASSIGEDNENFI
jgi:hypothetical protein